MNINEIEAKEALHKLNRRGLPYQYDLNIYRGCSHGCKYCYAEKSHKYLQSNNFDKEIFVKTNIVEALEKALSSPNWKGDIINIGGVCDSYQHAEKKYKLMPEVLKVMIKYKNPIIISTKSDLILRDIDLIDELAKHTYVNIAFCITSCDEEVSKNVEPGASLPMDRYRALCEFSKTNANTGLHVMPIIPYLADDKGTLENLVRLAAEGEASYMLTGVLYMTGGIKKRYMNFICEKYPEYYNDYVSLYPKGGANKEYKTQVHGFLKKMREKYNVNNSYAKFLPKHEL